MASKASDGLVAWLDRFLKTARPGRKMPTDRELAFRFGISDRTVRSILTRYHNQGKVRRVWGSGTYAPGESREIYPIRRSRASYEAVVDFIRTAMNRGELKQGQALPSIKYMSMQFSLAPATVITAYRKLQELGNVRQVGKTFWVGQFRSLINPGSPSKELLFFRYRSRNFRDVFRDPLAPAVQRMLDELYLYGYAVRFLSTAELSSYERAWKTDTPLPFGVMFFGVTGTTISDIAQHVSRIAQACARTRPAILLDVASEYNRRRPAGVHIVSRGHIATAVARAIARYSFVHKFSWVYFFLDESFAAETGISPLVHTWLEMKTTCPGTAVRIIVKTVVAGETKQHFLARYRALQDRDVETLWFKYPRLSRRQLIKNIKVVDRLPDKFPYQRRKMAWIFSSDDEALNAIKWARTARHAVAGNLSILTLQNDPRIYHLGIGCCVPDYDTLGYLMAHAVIGDFPVAKDSRGYLDVSCRLMEKTTAVKE